VESWGYEVLAYHVTTGSEGDVMVLLRNKDQYGYYLGSETSSSVFGIPMTESERLALNDILLKSVQWGTADEMFTWLDDEIRYATPWYLNPGEATEVVRHFKAMLSEMV
jgi:hypothetical protein